MESGIIIGELAPVHQGHIQMIEFALLKVRHLHVVIFNCVSEKNASGVQKEWQRILTLIPNVTFHLLPFQTLDSLTQHFLLPDGINVLFSSDQTMGEVAQRLQVTFWYMQNHQPFRSTLNKGIRQNPFKFWDQIPMEIKPYFVKKVVLFGPESTGKSTLSVQLAKEFDTLYNPEFVRSYLDLKQQIHGPATSAHDLVKAQDLEPIALGQLASEQNMAKQANKLLFLDTNLFMTALYAKYYFGEAPQWLWRLVEQEKYDLYLLLTTDLPFVKDPLRDSAFQQKELHTLFKETLIEKGLPFFEISGKGEERLQSASQKVRQYFRLEP